MITIVNDDAASSPPPPPSPTNACTQTVVPGRTWLRDRCGGRRYDAWLAAGTCRKISLTSVSKASDATVQPAPGADVTIDGLWFRVVNHVRFTGAGGSMRIRGLDIDPVDGDVARSHHLTFDHVVWTAGDGLSHVAPTRRSSTNVSAFRRGHVRGQAVRSRLPQHSARGCDGLEQPFRWWRLLRRRAGGRRHGVQIGPGNEFENLVQGLAPRTLTRSSSTGQETRRSQATGSTTTQPERDLRRRHQRDRDRQRDRWLVPCQAALGACAAAFLTTCLTQNRLDISSKSGTGLSSVVARDITLPDPPTVAGSPSRGA